MDGEPVLLVDIQPDGTFSLNQMALERLRSIREQISVITVAGPYRSGKSYLLNRILGDQDHGFEIGPSVNPCTHGIWIWSQPIIVQDRAILLIDTEGLRSYERDENVNIKIFALSVLLSSVFIYNSLGVIDEDALDQLHLVCNLSEYIHVKSQGSSKEELAQYFPDFIWVLRDFALQLVDEDGEELTENEYLEGALQSVPGDDEETHQKNRIRRTIKKFFKNRECVTLIRPVNSDEKLRNIQEVDFHQLKPGFREKMQKLTSYLWMHAPVKMMDGVPLTGNMLASMLESYIQAIKADVMPNITTAWERAISAQIKACFDQGVKYYTDQFNQQIKPKVPMDTDEILQFDKTQRQLAMRSFNDVPRTATTVAKLEEFTLRLYEKMDEHLQAIMFLNQKQSRDVCQRVIDNLFAKFELQVSQSENFSWIHEAMMQMRDDYLYQAKGPLKFEVGFDKYSMDIQTILHKILARTEAGYKQKIKQLNEDVHLLQGERDGSTENFKREKRELVELLEYERRHAREDKRNLEEALEESQRALSGNNEEFAKIHRSLQDENLMLKKQLQNAKQNLAREKERTQAKAESINVDEFKRALQEIMTEATSTREKERFLLQQYEYEKKLTISERNSQKLLTEARRQSEDAINELKRSYEYEIRDLKEDKIALELKLKDMTKELTARDLHIKLLNEKLRNKESEKRLKIEHADLLCNTRY